MCVLIPRGFCGYLCPLGTLIDLFDWSISMRTTRFRVANDGWWVHVKYYLLLGVLICALLGVLVSGYVAAIPVLTRGLLFLGEPLQSGLLRGGHQGVWCPSGRPQFSAPRAPARQRSRELPDKCVGCGLCQTRCYGINVASKGLLEESAILIEAGEGKEDRLMNGSYRELREQEAHQREVDRQRGQHATDTQYYVLGVDGHDPDPFGVDGPDESVDENGLPNSETKRDALNSTDLFGIGMDSS